MANLLILFSKQHGEGEPLIPKNASRQPLVLHSCNTHPRAIRSQIPGARGRWAQYHGWPTVIWHPPGSGGTQTEQKCIVQ